MKYVSIECFSDRSYEQVMEECIGRLIDFTEVTFSDSYSAGSQMEFSVGPPKLMTAKGTTKVEYGHTQSFQAVQKEPIEVLLDAMEVTGRSLIVLDNFQNVKDERARRLVAQTMERLSDRSSETGDKKMVVIGIADDAPSLLAGSGSSTRRTAEVGVPRMPEDEIHEILDNGFRLLGLSAARDVLDRLVFFSDGFPYFAHLLGQSVARTARRENAGDISMGMVQMALVDAADQVAEGYESRVRRALEAGGDTQPRRRILELLAYDEGKLEWTSADVIRLFSEAHGPPPDVVLGSGAGRVSFLHTALAQLTSDKHGSMLKRTGTRGSFVYKFNDPHMRPYLRISTFPKVDPPE